MPFVLGRPSDSRLLCLAHDAVSLPFSYTERGITRHLPPPPTDLRFDHWTIDLETSTGSFERACEALRQWKAHRGAGARLFPPDSPIAVGQTVVVALPLPGFTAVAPCRIVWVDDEPDRFGFAYGTLEGHLERGEESFVVRRDRPRLVFEIAVASRPATLLPRIGAPVTRSIQKRVTGRYLNALAQAARSPTVSG